MNSICSFVKNNKALCIATAGLAIIGYLCYRLVRHIVCKGEKEQKVDDVAQKILKQHPEVEIPQPELPDEVKPHVKLIKSSHENTPEIKKEEPNQLKNQAEKKEIIKKPVILYMSLTGNPTHLGHMAVIATAIDAIRQKNLEVTEAKISLSDEAYHQRKVKREIANGSKKVALSQDARLHLLNEAIKEAEKRKMFDGVKVSYWNDQDQGESDHPDSYNRLAQSVQKTHDVYLVAGKDLCISMLNWPSVKNAVVVQRNMEHMEKMIPGKSNQVRIYAESKYPEFAHYSSSAIQNGTLELEPAELQMYFKEKIKEIV